MSISTSTDEHTISNQHIIIIITVGGSLCSARAYVHVLIFVFQELFKIRTKSLKFRLNDWKNVDLLHLKALSSINNYTLTFSRKKNTLLPFISVCVFICNKVSRLGHNKPLNIFHHHLQQKKSQTKYLAFGLIPNKLFKLIRSNTQIYVI